MNRRWTGNARGEVRQRGDPDEVGFPSPVRHVEDANFFRMGR